MTPDTEPQGLCPLCHRRKAPVLVQNKRFTASVESAFGEQFCTGHTVEPSEAT